MNDPVTTVRFAEDGPLIVESLRQLTGAGGPIPCEPKMALCRCGGSGNKPFCDGTHAKNGFSGARAGDRAADRVDDYVGKEVTIHDNRSICAHAGRCTDGLPAVWRMRQEPWIDPDGAAVREIVEVVRSCPSGALSCTVRDRDAAPPAGGGGPCHVRVAPGGPYAITGRVALDGQPLAAGADPERITLCRCGGSRNKPFCDGTHWNVEFDEAARA